MWVVESGRDLGNLGSILFCCPFGGDQRLLFQGHGGGVVRPFYRCCLHLAEFEDMNPCAYPCFGGPNDYDGQVGRKVDPGSFSAG